MALQIETGTSSVRDLAARDLARYDATPDAAPAAFAHAGPGGYRPEPSYHPQLAQITGIGRTDAVAANAGAVRDVSFEQEVRGQASQAIDLEFARIASDVYDPASRGIDGWTRLSDADLVAAGIDPASLENPDTGLRAAIYTDGDGRHVLAYAGSNDVQDWLTNARQGVGIDAEQYDQAVQLARDAERAFGDELVIVGHSLGGGLAATAALATDSAAVTFNAAGVNDATLRDLGLDPATAFANAADGQIRRYNLAGEALTTAQEDVPLLNRGLPDAPGHEITLADPAPPQAPEFTWNPVEMAKRTAEYVAEKAARPVELHMQQPMIQALEQQTPWN